MIAEAAQAASEVAKHTSTETLIGIGFLIVSNVGLWLDRFVTISKNRAEQEKAEAQEAEAKAAASKVVPNGNGNGIHEKWVLPHSLKLQELDGRVITMEGSLKKFEKDNSDQHERIFDKLDDIKDLVVGKSAGAA